ncbi:FAD-dependent oxidoreductase [Cellulomonas fimi]|uniref:FAD-dependent oxidoreductase n=1 Tax=Cellulomonas fimi TaxID=1708 RepID=A0A7Y0QHK1_CELFI|nr:FAD-dependent oxidoreductase [Cellulomonas fimi]NMR19979.1 FAD-dependent oxidoreductase [Cellulomonas fimi]
MAEQSSSEQRSREHSSEQTSREPRVVVVGGGYGGATVAKELDDVADVTLVEPRDAFVHAVGALRAVVDPDWESRVFLPYDRLLRRGRVVQATAQSVTPHEVRFAAAAGAPPHATGTDWGSRSIPADYLVLATGTAYPFPAKFIETDTWVAQARLVRLREALAACDRVLLVGAGPVGLELAGELLSAFPRLGITIVDQAHDVLTTGDYLPELRSSVRAQLEERGVVFELGAPLGYLPPRDVGLFEPFTVETTAGARVDAQLWFRCYGNRPLTDYLDGPLARARRWSGEVSVTPRLNVEGFETVFAVGDITDVPETKRAASAQAHAGVVAANIRALIEGRDPTATYTPAPELVILPLGTDGGASQLLDEEGVRRVLGPEETRRLKGADLYSGRYAELLGVQG